MRLTRGFTFLAAASLAAGTVVAVTVPHAMAAGDTDSISPASTTVVGTSPTSGGQSAGEFTATGTIDGLPITVTCTTTSITAKTPARGLGPVTVKPKFSGCTDSGGGIDTVKTFGLWKLTFVDAANDETGEVSGDVLKIVIPKGGATFKSSILTSCTVTVAPTAPFTINSPYDDVNTSNEDAMLPVGGTGCTVGNGLSHTTAKYVLSPGMHDVS